MTWELALHTIAALGGVNAIVRALAWIKRKLSEETRERLILTLDMHGNDLCTVNAT